MRKMVIYGSASTWSARPIVLLTADSNQFLPIWIGHPEKPRSCKLQGSPLGR